MRCHIPPHHQPVHKSMHHLNVCLLLGGLLMAEQSFTFTLIPVSQGRGAVIKACPVAVPQAP
jgi:hypothetical protein